MTLSEIIDKRRDRWEHGVPDKGIQPHDINYDKKVVQSGVESILQHPETRQEVLDKPYLLIEAAMYVVDKNKQTVPFFLNEIQREFIRELETRGTERPFFILKGRQQGFTTLITAIQLSYAITRKNFSGFTLADTADNTEAIFTDKAKTVYDRLPALLHPREKYSNRREYFFDKLNSSWRISTATSDVGRSRTLNFVHFSEVAFFNCSLGDLQAAIRPAIVKDAVVIYETTANGFNEAKTLWDSGTCVNLFYEWWRSPEYRSDRLELVKTDDPWLSERLSWLRSRGLDDRQLAWYSQTYADYIDKSKIRQEYPCTPEEAFLFSGDSVFDAELVTQAMQRATAHPVLSRRGRFEYRSVETPLIDERGDKVGGTWSLEDIRWVDDRGGMIKIHEEPRTRTEDGVVTGNAPYVIGADTAGSGDDFWAAKVIDNMTKKTVATLHVRNLDADRFTEQLICLGKLYHDAMIAIEINLSPYPVMALTRKYSYPNVYMRERYDKTYDERTKEPGFLTNRATKPAAVDNLVMLFRDFQDIECDPDTLHEMSVFVRKEGGKTEAVEGEHDDLVMALAIAHMSASQQTGTWIAVKQEIPDHLKWFFGSENNENDDSLSAGMRWDDL